MNEVHAMLHRGRELVTQAANDTNTEFDRSQIQEELNQLNEEIDHIANRTEFNTKKLLKGDAGIVQGATTSTGPTKASGDIEKLTERVLNSMLGQSEKMAYEAYGIKPNQPYNVDVSYVDEAPRGRVGWVSVQWQTTTDGAGNSTTISYPTDLVLDKQDFFGNSSLWISPDRIVAHEMVHAVMGGAINGFSNLPG